MKVNNKIMGFLFLVFPLFGFALESKTADIFEMKSRLEAVVSKKFRKALETRLSPEDFNVTVNLDMVREEKVKPSAAQRMDDSESQFLPSLPGYVSANTIMNMYEKELDQDGRKKSEEYNYLNDLKNYRIRSAGVSVGLTREFDKDYQDKLKAWLSSRMKQEFGATSTAEIGIVAVSPKPVSTQSVFEKLEKLQWPLIVIMFALLALCGLCVYQVFKSKVRNAELKNRLNIKKLEMENARERDEEKKKLASQESEDAKIKRLQFEFEANKLAIQKRIATALKNFPDQTSAITTLITYEDGGQKVAALLDSSFAIEGRNENVYKIPEVFFQLDIPDGQRKEIQKSFISYQNLSGEDKLKVLESCFWSLATIGVLSDYQDKKPFQYLRRLTSSKITNALKYSKPEEQLVAVLHLPEEYQRSYMAGLSEDTKVEMIENTFKKEKVTWEELQIANESVHQTFKKVENEFGMVQGAIELLKSIKTRDEIKIISKLGKVNPSAFEMVRSHYVSLAFVEMWDDHSIKVLVEGLEVPDLATLIKTFPRIKERVLSGLTEMVSRILLDDLQIQESVNQALVDATLDRIRNQLRALEKNGHLSIETIYSKANSLEEMRLVS